MRSLLISLMSLVLVLPSPVTAEEFNAGFVQGIWYSNNSLFSGTPTRIYVALRNHTDKDLSGTVQFTDNGARIGTAFVKALPGSVEEVWIDWTPTFGDHDIAATLIDVKLQAPGENPQAITIEGTLAKDTLFVDLDTDTDAVGNKEDPDDDGDGISDEDEIRAGTDPLVPDAQTAENETEDQKNDRDHRSHDRDDRENSDGNDASEAVPTHIREGLERFFGDGTVDTTFTKITDTIGGAKARLDAYRQERTENEVGQDTESTATNTELTGGATSTPTESLATITTTRIDADQPGIISRILGGITDFAAALYTLLLWFLSLFLAHPAIVELVLLILIIYIVFKTARRLASRPKEFG